MLTAVAVVLCSLPLLGASGCSEGSEGTTGTTPTAAQAPGSGPSAAGEEGGQIGRVLDAVDAGEPLPYEEDGGVFENREGLLPGRPLGYYREYTVVTPGEETRGARRLVIGEGGEVFYTRDHYASFIRIDPADYRGGG